MTRNERQDYTGNRNRGERMYIKSAEGKKPARQREEKEMLRERGRKRGVDREERRYMGVRRLTLPLLLQGFSWSEL